MRAGIPPSKGNVGGSQRAFTLIELLIVILIIAVMSAVITPSYLRFLDHARFRGATRQVQDIFAYARQEAVALNSTVTLSFDRQSESFTVTLPTAPADTDTPVAMNGSDTTDSQSAQTPAVPHSVQLSKDQSVTQYSVAAPTNPAAVPQNAGPNDLHFQGDGTVEGLDMLMVQTDGAHAHLVLSPATGRLTLDIGGSI